MSETPSYNNNEKFEVIDNKKQIDFKLNNLEKNTDVIESHINALSILNRIDSQIKGIDISLAYDKEKDSYHFISGESGLDFPIKLNSLEDVGNILIELFSKDIELNGDYYGRFIKEDGIFNFFYKDILSSKNSELSKKQIAELFVFTMKAKGIEMDDWDISNTMGSPEYLGIDFNEDIKPFAFKENQKTEDFLIEKKELNEFIEKNKDIFNGKSLKQIKEIISSNEKDRRNLSLLFLSNVINNGYNYNTYKKDESLTFIKNFTTDEMECRHLMTLQGKGKLDFNNPLNSIEDFKYDKNGNTSLEITIINTEDNERYGIITMRKESDIKLLNELIKQ